MYDRNAPVTIDWSKRRFNPGDQIMMYGTELPTE
jgi:hypothetical protein